jgi:hypothetical protein
MKRLCMLATLAGVMAAPSLFAGFDGQISFAASTHQSGNGGEFNAVTTGLGSFATFCLEENENIGQPPSGPYDYFINSGAVKGGTGVDATDSHTGLPMDNISIGTAWLYSQFRAGTLTLDNGTGSYFSGDQTAHAGELQNAIWYLEGEGGLDNGYVALATANLAAGYAKVTDDSLGKYGVVALNLYDGAYYQDVTINGKTYEVNQDMLGIVPEPTTVLAGMLLLLPFGASTLRILRKKIAA